MSVVIYQAPAINVGFENISFKNDTTLNTNDSITITGGNGSALGEGNEGKVRIQSTDGSIKTYRITADVTIDLTGAHWDNGGTGDLTDAVLEVVAIHDNNSSIVWGVAWCDPGKFLASTDTSATTTSVTARSSVLVKSSLTAGTWACMQLGYFKANFDDADGAAADLWEVQSGVGDLVLGSSDGVARTYNPVYTGMSAQTMTAFSYKHYGRIARLCWHISSWGTGSATSRTMTSPVKAANRQQGLMSGAYDNGSYTSDPCGYNINSGDVVTSVYIDEQNNANWTASGNTGFYGIMEISF